MTELAANAGFPPDRSGITEVAGAGGPFCTTMSWDDIEWMSGVSDLPIVLKGVSSPLDAQLAAEMSVRGAVAGIVISNHGGRNLDGAIGTADALPRCAAVSWRTTAIAFFSCCHLKPRADSSDSAIARQAAAKVEGSTLQIFIDGGVRRGKDIVRALALGADAVMIGRPVHWALTVGGSDGVAHALSILKDELGMALQLCGCKSPADVVPDHVWRVDGARL